MARVPDGVDLAMAAAAPTAGLGLSLVELLEPLDVQVVLIVGAGGGVGTFATQFGVNAGARVIANIDAQAEGRMRAYGVTGTVLRSQVPVNKAVRQSHPDGIDALIDLVSDSEAFASNAALVHPGGTAITTQYVADLEALQASGITGVNLTVMPGRLSSRPRPHLAGSGQARSPDSRPGGWCGQPGGCRPVVGSGPASAGTTTPPAPGWS